MRTLIPVLIAMGSIQFQACRSRTVDSADQKSIVDKSIVDKNLATCRVLELDQTLFHSLKDSIKLESISNQNESPSEIQTVQVIKAFRGPTTMRIGDTVLYNAAPFKTDDASMQAFGVESLNQPISYVLIVKADKSGTLGYYENAQLRYGHRPQDISKVFAKVECE